MLAGIYSVIKIIEICFIALLILSLALEIMARIVKAIRKTFFINEVRRKDFLASGYQEYINWIEDWSKPMFNYHPIGFRLFNNDHVIPPINNNSLGFRSEEFSEPNPDELRLIILGGSSAWGCGASSNEATIAGQLEKIMNSDRRLLGAFRRAKCYNLAQVNGYQTQDLLTMLFIAPKLKPHYVLSLSGWNELVANGEMKPELLKKYGVFYISEMEGWQPLGVAGGRKKLLGNAFRHYVSEKSELLRIIFSRSQNGMPATKPSIREQIDVGATLFIDHLRKLQMLAKTLGSKHIQFMQPYLFRKRNLTEQEKKIIHLYDEVRPVMGGKKGSNYLRENDIYLPILSAFEKDPMAAVIVDLCDIFRDEQASMFYTLVHLTDNGYRKIAETIYQELLRLEQSDSKEAYHA